ncbi:hypothetical protein BpHYR1_007218 [Brachionus plicatilis]|uniref:Uncharacterized protein n=1 Tax=Brachionus plicatilis TaxID=10195 RepID=A0A3M7PEB9_BRAPC|nr:hypothetical protein BpHYR1_007218 [Brachionus plicatilis]
MCKKLLKLAKFYQKIFKCTNHLIIVIIKMISCVMIKAKLSFCRYSTETVQSHLHYIRIE